MTRIPTVVSLVAGAAAVLAVACGDSEGDPAETLRPAGEIREATRAAAGAAAASVGETVELESTAVTVERAVYAERPGRERSSDGGPWLLVTVRVDNPSQEAQTIDFNISCSSGREGSRYVWEAAGAFEPFDEIPAGAYDGGDILFGLPDGCTGPLLEAKEIGVFFGQGERPVARWLLPDPGPPSITLAED